MEKTAQMIEATLRWRREYGVEKLRAEDFADLPADEIAPKADADGHSVVTLRMGAVPKSAFANRARYLRWRLCMQERGLRSLALGKADAARPGFVYVLDCSGLKAFHVSKAARRCATRFSDAAIVASLSASAGLAAAAASPSSSPAALRGTGLSCGGGST